MNGEETKVRDSLFFAYKDVQRAVRNERWKLIRYPCANETQLFDLQNDPQEMNDLAEDSSYRSKVNDMMDLL